MSVQINSSTPQVQSQAPMLPISRPVIEPIKSSTEHHVIESIRNKEVPHHPQFQSASKPVGEDQLIKAIERAAKVLAGPTTSVEMQIHKQTHSVVMRVVNKETGDLIREVPPEKMLDLVAKMMEFAGILIDEKV